MQTSQHRLVGGFRSKCILSETRGHPLVSVITAVYNGEQYIAECVESVLSQSYSPVEHLIFDGGSTDDTVDILKRYDDRIAMWSSEPDNGIYDAWNKALRQARGEWICFLGSDDVLLQDAIHDYMTLAERNPVSEYLSSRVQVIHPSGYIRTLGSAWNWKTFSRRMCTAHVGSMHRRSLYQRLGTYDASYRIVADYELLLRARSGLRTAYMPIVTAKMRAGGISSTRLALEEQALAKVTTGGRNKMLSYLEMFFQKGKTILHPPVRFILGKLMTHKVIHPFKNSRV